MPSLYHAHALHGSRYCALPSWPFYAFSRSRLMMSCTGLSHSLSAIKQARVIACVRAHSADLAHDMACSALDGGLNVLEVTMTTPGAAKVISRLVEKYPLALIGAGTVLSMPDADAAKSAGAKFLMSPVTMQEMIESHCHGPTLIIPGAITPTEVFNAYSQGASLVKLHPVSLMGGVEIVRALKKAMPHIPLVASQGISFESFDEYLRAGATAVVLSDAIFNKNFVNSRDFKKIRQRANLVAEKAASSLCNSELN